MMNEVIIDIHDLSKAYPLYSKPIDMLKELILGGVRHDLFWALRNVSFRVRPGQRVGIIGPNGAGKSTLLQIIAGNLLPSSGSVKVNGRISALLSLVPAWNLEENGIENIRFNLLLQGYRSSQITFLTEEIIDFAELGPFINQPVKTYSSGMSARLSFAIATAISPEILIVDEVLGAGDGYFANKAMRRMKEICDRGKALLFVSHSTAAVRLLCDTAIWLESGSIRLFGPVDTVTTKYDEDTLRSDDEILRRANIQRVEENIHTPSPDEIERFDLIRLRLRSPKLRKGPEIHYVSEIKVSWNLRGRIESITLPLDSTDDPTGSHLDAMGCEWGRLYTRHNVVSRMLLSRTGARKGGHFLIKKPLMAALEAWHINVGWTVTSQTGSELILEFIDLDSAAWKPLEVQSKIELENGWIRYMATGCILPVDEGKKQLAIEIANEKRMSPIKIIGIIISTKNGPTNSIRECEPFSIKINVECVEQAPAFNLSLILYRSDGMYMFWQPSDFNGPLDTTGSSFVEITFHFDENYFAAGDYVVTVNAMGSLNIKNELIQSEIEIFDRRISAASFTITRQFPSLQFGALNYLARIEMIKQKSIYRP